MTDRDSEGKDLHADGSRSAHLQEPWQRSHKASKIMHMRVQSGPVWGRGVLPHLEEQVRTGARPFRPTRRMAADGSMSDAAAAHRESATEGVIAASTAARSVAWPLSDARSTQPENGHRRPAIKSSA